MKRYALCILLVIIISVLGSCSLIPRPDLLNCINRFYDNRGECSLREQMDSIEEYTSDVFDDLGLDIDVNATLASTIGYDGESKISFSLYTSTNLINTDHYDKFLEFYNILREDLDAWIDSSYTLVISINDDDDNKYFYADIVFDNHRVSLYGGEDNTIFEYIVEHQDFLQHVLDHSDFESNAIDIWFSNGSDVMMTKENQDTDVSVMWDSAGTSTTTTEVVNYLNVKLNTYTFFSE